VVRVRSAEQTNVVAAKAKQATSASVPPLQTDRVENNMGPHAAASLGLQQRQSTPREIAEMKQKMAEKDRELEEMKRKMEQSRREAEEEMRRYASCVCVCVVCACGVCVCVYVAARHTRNTTLELN
jgi:predicted RNase H-like nuclease (RuvC/YqgF family)